VSTATVTVPQLPNHKTKLKKPGQRSCNEKDDKGKICAGHLKRWYYMADVKEQACGDVQRMLGPNAEVYRCEFCKTLYFPNPDDPKGLNVAGRGRISVFGLTLPPKDNLEKSTQATGANPDAKKADAEGKPGPVPPASAPAKPPTTSK
jgi:hypothetical protein